MLGISHNRKSIAQAQWGVLKIFYWISSSWLELVPMDCFTWAHLSIFLLFCVLLKSEKVSRRLKIPSSCLASFNISSNIGICRIHFGSSLNENRKSPSLQSNLLIKIPKIPLEAWDSANCKIDDLSGVSSGLHNKLMIRLIIHSQKSAKKWSFVFKSLNSDRNLLFVVWWWI